MLGLVLAGALALRPVAPSIVPDGAMVTTSNSFSMRLPAPPAFGPEALAHLPAFCAGARHVATVMWWGGPDPAQTLTIFGQNGRVVCPATGEPIFYAMTWGAKP